MSFLYHATFNARIPSIKEYGLGAKQPKVWLESQDGLIYFATDPYVAESYCEASDDVPDDLYDSGISILCVETRHLKSQEIVPDINNNEEGDTIAYTGGIISSEFLFLWTGSGIIPLLEST